MALLPLALDAWSSDAAGYGLATGVLGFAAFGAPLLRRLGRTAEHSIALGPAAARLGLLLVVPVPTLAWSLAPLALAGAAAVSVEAGATAVLQEHVHDEVRATVLGINDTVIIAAALVGSLVAPVAVDLVGGAVLLAGAGRRPAARGWWARPRRHAARRHHAAATVVATRLEAHGPARTQRHPCGATALLVALLCVRERLLAVEQRASRRRRRPTASAERPREPAALRRAR